MKKDRADAKKLASIKYLVAEKKILENMKSYQEENGFFGEIDEKANVSERISVLNNLISEFEREIYFIEDEKVQKIMNMFYVQNISWPEVAKKTYTHRAGSSAPRKLVNRYISRKLRKDIKK